MTGVEARCPPRLATTLERYKERLQLDLDRGDSAASLLGLHSVFEGLGYVAMQAPIGDLGRMGARLMPLRTRVLQQEMAHQRLGDIWMPCLSDDTVALRDTCSRYLDLSEAVVAAGGELLAGFAVDRQAYVSEPATTSTPSASAMASEPASRSRVFAVAVLTARGSALQGSGVRRRRKPARCKSPDP